MYSLFILVCLVPLWMVWRNMNRALYRDAFSPFNLLFYFWIAPFVLSLAELSSLQKGFSGGALLVVFTSTLILIATCLVPAFAVNRSRSKPRNVAKSVELHPGGIIVFFLVTLVALYYAEFSDRDLPLIAYLIGDVTDSNLHTAGKDSKLQVIAFGIYAAAILLFHLWLVEKNRWRRASYLCVCLLIVSLGLLKTSKSDIYIPILSFAGLTYYHYRDNKLKVPRRFKVLAFIVACLVISITAVRLEGIGLVGGYASLIEFKYSEEIGAFASQAVSIVYGYTALGFQNFSNFFDSNIVEFRIGTSLFRPVLSMLMMGQTADAMGVSVERWNVVSDAANTGTFLTPLYIEGGALFCFLGAAVYGTLVNTVYVASRSPRSLKWRLVYVSLLFPWTWLFFTNAFSVLSIYVNVFYVLALSALSTRHLPRKRSSIVVPEVPDRSLTLRADHGGKP